MDLDITLFVQFGVIVALMLLLERLLFRPLLQVIEARHQQIHGTRQDVDRLLRLGSTDKQAYEKRLRAARQEAAQEREAQRLRGQQEARALLTQKRAQISQQLAQTREEVAAAERAARQDLDPQAENLARLLVEKLLGRSLAS